MVEAHLRAAIRAGLTEADFWVLTPYNLSLRLQEVNRARVEKSLYTGWFAERFAREKELQGPVSYIKSMLEADPKAEAALAEAMARAEFHRMATAKGLEVEPAPDAE